MLRGRIISFTVKFFFGDGVIHCYKFVRVAGKWKPIKNVHYCNVSDSKESWEVHRPVSENK